MPSTARPYPTPSMGVPHRRRALTILKSVALSLSQPVYSALLPGFLLTSRRALPMPKTNRCLPHVQDSVQLCQATDKKTADSTPSYTQAGTVGSWKVSDEPSRQSHVHSPLQKDKGFIERAPCSTPGDPGVWIWGLPSLRRPGLPVFRSSFLSPPICYTQERTQPTWWGPLATWGPQQLYSASSPRHPPRLKSSGTAVCAQELSGHPIPSQVSHIRSTLISLCL